MLSKITHSRPASTQATISILAMFAMLVMAATFMALYPPWDFQLLAWVATAPCVVFLSPFFRRARSRAALAGLAFGQIAGLTIVGPWMFPAAVDFFGWSATYAGLFTAGIIFIHVAIFYAPLMAGVATLAYMGPVFRILGVATLWTAQETIRAHTLFGNPWAQLGQAAAAGPFLGLLSIAGTPALTWLVAAIGAAIGCTVIARDPRERLRAVATGTVILGLAFALVSLVPTSGSTSATRSTLRVATIDPQIERKELWDPLRSQEHLRRYLSISRAMTVNNPELIVWPENAVPFLLDADSDARQAIQSLADDSNAAVILGAGRSATNDGRVSVRNSVWLFTPGQPPQTYDKRRLLPYIEEAPQWLDRTLPDRWGMDYEPGGAAVVWKWKNWNIAPLVCFEAIYPRFARDAIANGADLLVNVTNDSWFSSAGGPGQHFAIARLRSAEVGVPMVRVAAGGRSAALDATGRMVAPETTGENGAVYVLQHDSKRTVYVAGGYLAEWCNVIAALGLLLVANRKQRQLS
ncbi:MAG: apolipoprotein N-acyltransferase [Hyphomicrobiaceae bacterium]|jgi:apolipoprotein N-acyltransferase